MALEYEANSIAPPGVIAIVSGVMIGAGIFALAGQIGHVTAPAAQSSLNLAHTKKE